MRKIGELKGKPIVEGNPNEIKNNQIHIKTEGGGITLSERKNGNLETISGGSSEGASNKYINKYYIFKEGAPNDLIEEIIMLGGVIKIYIYGDKFILPYSAAIVTSGEDKKYLGFSFTPFYAELNGKRQFIENIEDYFINAGEDILTIIMNNIIKVTEEEFYKVD
jgi:hypothetical protein